ncbi:hypothetical protein ABIE41_004416 [Bosea sp. OAE506]|uniref:hypothetical protein n=1 Tax=Bosea sp. OAE506 TaxID=2663870 RepID=UPI00178A5044
MAKHPRLSTDYLNRFAEALMLIDLAADDPDIVQDLKAWRSVTYREHFETSPLRIAASALAAYDLVPPERREGFEELCRAMTRLVTTATALLADRADRLDAITIVEVAGDALRRQIARATEFINANGAVDIVAIEMRELQAEVDALLRR